MMMSFLATAFFFLLYWPDTQPDPSFITKLQAAQGEVQGRNGYQALFLLPPISEAERAGQAFLCSREESDCLAFVRAHQAEYPAIAAAMQQREASLDDLLQYDYFRPRPEQYDFNAEMPSFQFLLRARNLHAYRFLNGEIEAAQRGACRDAVLGRRLVYSRGHLINSIIGVALIERNVALLAQMRAELPPEAPWPLLCDELQPLPQETLALCPLMYGGWLEYHREMEKSAAENTAADDADRAAVKAYSLLLLRQAVAQELYEKTKYCAPAVLTAIARDTVQVPEPDKWPRYCSPLNLLCQMDRPRNTAFQARLLNANRYLRAFAALRDPAATLPEGYRLENGQLHFQRHPEHIAKEEGMQPVSLPLPGSRPHQNRAGTADGHEAPASPSFPRLAPLNHRRSL